MPARDGSSNRMRKTTIPIAKSSLENSAAIMSIQSHVTTPVVRVRILFGESFQRLTPSKDSFEADLAAKILDLLIRTKRAAHSIYVIKEVPQWHTPHK